MDFYVIVWDSYGPPPFCFWYNCSHTNWIDQLAPFKSTVSPLSLINFTFKRLMFTGPKYMRSWFCSVPPNSTKMLPGVIPDVFTGIRANMSFTKGPEFTAPRFWFWVLMIWFNEYN